MLFFSKSWDVLYLTSQSLTFYSKKNFDNEASFLLRNETLDFPPTLIAKLKVVDKTKLEETIIEFLASLGLKKIKPILLLSTEVTFEKTLPLDDSFEEGVKIFQKSIPIDPKTLSVLEVLGDKEILLVGTNRETYQTIKEALGKIGGELVSAVPASIFEGVGAQKALSAEEIKTVFKKSKLVSKNNFLNIKKETGPFRDIGDEVPKDNNLVKVLMYILGVIFLAALIGGGAVYFGFLKNPLEKPSEEMVVSVNLREKKESTQSAIIEASKAGEISDSVVKEKVSVQILNGTGISGQAGRAKEALEAIGYKNFQTGNATSSATKDTLVTYRLKFSKSQLDEILVALKKVFGKVATPTASIGGTKDLTITTGSY